MTQFIKKYHTPKMIGLMQDVPLLTSSLLTHSELHHPEGQISTLTAEGYTHHTNFFQLAQRAKKLANALRDELHIQEGDMVGTVAFNTFRHLEAYYGISGIGAVLHTINPRLFPQQLEFIINHSRDTVLFVDLPCVPIIAKLYTTHQLGCKRIVVMTDEDRVQAAIQQFPANLGLQFWSYESLLERHSNKIEWPVFDERTAACLCYTSGTTGNPKGVLYSHRSTVLHALFTLPTDVLGLNSYASVLVMVNLFHVNGWGLAFSGAMTGCKLVFTANNSDGKSVAETIYKERVTHILGVPTVYLALFDYVDKNPQLPPMNLQKVLIGGSAAPLSMIERIERGITGKEGPARPGEQRAYHAWGMSELSPIGSTGSLKAMHEKLSLAERVKVQAKQGRGVYGVQWRIVDDNGKALSWNGKESGSLQVRGPSVTTAYFRYGKDGATVEHGQEVSNLTSDGWFDTGDVGRIDDDGYLVLTDRSKDVIKSGGEWISSIDLENVAVGHPAVAEACVVGHRHTKWQERPLLLAVLRDSKKPATEEKAAALKKDILDYISERVVKWWMPNGILFVDELPHTATGKLAKVQVRESVKDYVFPDDPANVNALKSKL